MYPKRKLTRWLRSSWRILRFFILALTALSILGGSAVPYGSLASQVRSLTREIEFDFSTWTFDAIGRKLAAGALNLVRFTPPQSQNQAVLEYLDRVRNIQILTAEIASRYADPNTPNADVALSPLWEELEKEKAQLRTLAPLVESTLQSQLMGVLKENGLDFLGQVIPPSLYQVSDVPLSLVVSPRSEILNIMEVSIQPGLSVESMEHLEAQVLSTTDHSALIVPIGGIGSYPTMVMHSFDLVWLTEVIAHEWVHNFLTLRPLGINYNTSPELRTLNETTASLAGKELGKMILAKYYPQFLPKEEAPTRTDTSLPNPSQDGFDFRKEMRITRVETERLLAKGALEEAEAYMEARRLLFWEKGFQIRKINQAYFAFYGAYNDIPGGGASGEDPVGPAVRSYRAQFESLGDFLNNISWVSSFEDLLAKLEG